MRVGKPTRMALRNASQSRTAQRATTPKDRSNLAGALRAFDLHKASYREPRRAPKGEHDGRPRLGVAPGSRLFLVAYESADGKPYAFALSDLDVAHKLARARGGEVIDTPVDRMADSDFLN